MSTVEGGVTACRRVQLLVSGAAFMLAFSSQVAAGAPGGTPGGAVPKDDPWAMNVQQDVAIDIPRASERPLSVDDGPRIRVSAFKLDTDPALSAALSPELNSQINALVDERLRAAPGAGFTIGQLEQVASAVTDLLRGNDFIVAYAYIPAQEVASGSVTIGLLGGTLGQVNVEGNRVLSSERISLPFNSLVGRPLQKGDLESAILNLRDYPGLAPSAVLSPGQAVGTTDLTLRVSERRFELVTMADNYGSQDTGEYRARVRADINSPFKAGDRLTLNILQTFDPTNGTYGGIGYQIPVGAGGLIMGALVDTNTFDSRAGGVSISGDSTTGALFARQHLKRSRFFNLDLRADLAYKEATYDIPGPDPEDTLTVGSIYLDLEAVDRIGPLGVNSLNIGYSHGFPDFLGSMDDDGTNGDSLSTRVGKDGNRASGEFDKGFVQYQRLQQITPANSVVLRLFGQYSDDILTSLEQMTLGGPYSVRAYPTAEFLADKAIFGSLEYTLNVSTILPNPPSSWDLNFSVFYDYADGQINDALQNEESTEVYAGYGAGLQWEYRWSNGSGFVVRGEVASKTTGVDPSDGDDPQYWLRMEYFRH